MSREGLSSNMMLEMGLLINYRGVLRTVSEAGKSKIEVLADSVCGASHTWSWMVSAHCVLTHGWGKGALSSLCYKGTNPIVGALPSGPHHPPKALPPKPIPLGVRFQHLNFGGTSFRRRGWPVEILGLGGQGCMNMSEGGMRS